jgi:D-alanyl-D-alanine carboxypeptidase
MDGMSTLKQVDKRFRMCLLLIGCLFVLAPPASAMQGEGGQEQIAIAWTEALNGGLDSMAAFREQHVEEADRPGWRETVAELRENWGNLEVYGLMIEERNQVVVGVVSEKEGRRRLTFSFNDSNKIVGIDIGEARTNPVPPLELDVTDERPVEAIDAFLSELADQEILSGSVLIATDGEIWFERAYGLASREFAVPNTIATRFDVGSFNKDYTRLAIMQLLENGQLALTDTVGRYLSDYPNVRVRTEVTIDQLLEHRSGLGDYFTREYLATPMRELREIDDYIPIWGPMPLEYEPGTREEYSNYGYTVLGAIIERITGLGYPEYVEDNVFDPAGMHSTGFFETDGVEPNVAVGYTYMDGMGRPTETLRKNIYLEPVKGGPWGKSYSTARDLFRFFEAMFSGGLLGDDYNWLLDGWNGQTALAGGGPGLSAILLIEDGIGVIVLANHDAPGAEDVASRLLQALR